MRAAETAGPRPGAVCARARGRASEPQGLLRQLPGHPAELLPVVPPHLRSVHVGPTLVVGLCKRRDTRRGKGALDSKGRPTSSVPLTPSTRPSGAGSQRHTLAEKGSSRTDPPRGAGRQHEVRDPHVWQEDPPSRSLRPERLEDKRSILLWTRWAPLLRLDVHPAPAPGQGEVDAWPRGTPDSKRCPRQIRTHTQRQQGREAEAQSRPGAGPTAQGARTVGSTGWEQKRQPRGQLRAGPWSLPPAQPCVPLWPPRLCPSNHDGFFLPFIQEALPQQVLGVRSSAGDRVCGAHPPRALQTGPSTHTSFQTWDCKVGDGRAGSKGLGVPQASRRGCVQGTPE